MQTKDTKTQDDYIETGADRICIQEISPNTNTQLEMYVSQKGNVNTVHKIQG